MSEISSEEIIFNRYLVVLGALVIQLCLGSIYAWSIFQASLKDVPYEWDELFTQLPFSTGLASFAVVMVIAGRWQDKIGPTKVASLGGILLGTGYMLAFLVDPLFGDSEPIFGFMWLMVTYGVISGAGIGLAYVCPIASLVKWFPDIKGLITGIAVAGFGAGALIFAQAETILIDINNDEVGLAFLVLGIIYLILVVVSAQLLRNPPEGWLPAGYTPPEHQTESQIGKDYEWQEMMRTPQFWLLWTMFIFGAAAGLMTIGNVKSFVQDQNTSIDAAMAATIVGLLSICNAAGRIVWGAVSDRIGRIYTLIIMFSILGVTMVIYGNVTELIFLTLGAMVIGFCFGGNFALFPSTTADYFGSKNVGQNYGIVFTAYGVAGVSAGFIAGFIVDTTDSYLLAFILMGVLVFIAVALAVFAEFINRQEEASIPS
ncbi:MAG: OFA family MFS transporter [Promethearchaeota archaeon]